MFTENTYTLSRDGAGNWTATYVAVETMVPLGASVGTITIVRTEDGRYRHMVHRNHLFQDGDEVA